MVSGGRAAPFPGFIQPCSPVERKEPPSGEGWLHEIKHDGYRLQAHVRDQAVRLYTSDGHNWTDRMPAIAASVAALPVTNLVLDGELCAIDAAGAPAFYELPAALGVKTRVKGNLIYYAFDMLYLDGVDLRATPLIERKRLLEVLLDNTRGMQRVKYVAHIEADGATVLDHACALGLEGIVSKLADSAYKSGNRREWSKTKCAAWKEANRNRFDRMTGGAKPRG